MKRISLTATAVTATICGALSMGRASSDDHLRELQTEAIEKSASPAAHWGTDPSNYVAWSTHTNRLVPVYTFGTCGAGDRIDLRGYMGKNSAYRSPERLQQLYGRVPSNTLNPQARYLDQTAVADIQFAGADAGKKYIFLVIFDGMDWQTSRAASIHNLQTVAYESGRGRGLHFLDYDANGTSQFGYMVTSPHNNRTKADVDKQTLFMTAGGKQTGGYDAAKAGARPWDSPAEPEYLTSGVAFTQPQHAYADSAGTATAMTSGVKTYNGAINIDPQGNQLLTIAHYVQKRGLAVGAVSSVPISHATPAAAYAHNVNRNDTQDIVRDMLGMPSVSHPDHPLPGLDVLIGGGFGLVKQTDRAQGSNFLSGNPFMAETDLERASVENGGRYVVAVRTAGSNGHQLLESAATTASKNNQRLLGLFGLGQYKGHLPYQTANGDHQPAPGRTNKAETYTAADIDENPTLAQMTQAAITVLSGNASGFWLMVEAGDVDWANHDNNLDNSIGAVNSGDQAVRMITNWVEKHSNWNESLLIVTADHGHFLVLTKPEALIR